MDSVDGRHSVAPSKIAGYGERSPERTNSRNGYRTAALLSVFSAGDA